MEFEYYLTQQLNKHPSMEPRDVVKLCYQAAFGAEHLLADPERARRYLEQEYAAVTAAEGELLEPISDAACRVNLAVWKARDLPVDDLFRLFVASCKVEEQGKEKFAGYLRAAEGCLDAMPFSKEDWEHFMALYREQGMPAVHHSQQYRQKEHPAYRIVSRELCRDL